MFLRFWRWSLNSFNVCDRKLAPLIYVVDLLLRTIQCTYILDSQNALHTRKTTTTYIPNHLCRPGRARQCRTGLGTGQWATGQWALQGCERLGKAAQNRCGQCREVPDSVGRGQTRRGVGQCRTALGKNWHGQRSAEPDRSGKGSVRQYRACRIG